MEFEIAYKWVLLGLPLPLLVYLLLPAFKKRRSGLKGPFMQRAAELSGRRPLVRSWISPKGILTYAALALCWMAVLAAAASPRLTGKPEKRPKTVRSFLVTADISFSMAQTDWVVDGKRSSRWDAVRGLMQTFVAQRKSDQIGLVVFGSNAYLQAPLTTDLPMITWLLNETEVGMAGQMTNIGEAIAYSTRILRADTIKQKIIFLITDGVDTGTDLLPLDAAEQARKEGIVIYTLGIGKAKGSGGYDLDEKTLRDIARITQGRYFNAMDENQLKEVYATLEQLTPVTYEEESNRPVTLLYYFPLAAAVAVALLAAFVAGVKGVFNPATA